MSNFQTFLELELKSEHSKYYIEFNGIGVFVEGSRNPVNFKIPLNHWVINGENTIRVGVDFGEGDKLKTSKSLNLIANLNMRIKTGTQEVTRPITQFMLSSSKEAPNLIASNSSGLRSLDSENLFLPDENGDVKVSDWTRTETDTWIDFDQTIQLNLGYPEWAYLDADDLGDDETMSDDEFYALTDDLHKAYQEIWQLMQEKNLKELLKRFELRANEYDLAYHLKKGEKISDMEHSLKTAFEHEFLRLDDLEKAKYSLLTIGADNRVAVLRATSYNEPIISYSHIEGAYHRTYDMYFMRKNGKWIVIR